MVFQNRKKRGKIITKLWKIIDTVRSGAEERRFWGSRLDVLIFKLRSYHVLISYSAECSGPRFYKKLMFLGQAWTFLSFQARRSSATRSSTSDLTVSPWAKTKKSEATFRRSALLLSFCESRFSLSQLLKKLNSTERGALFRHFCISKVITTAHAHKSILIFHFFQELSNQKN